MTTPTVNISPVRLAIFVGSWAVAYFLGFFTRPEHILGIDSDSLWYSFGEAEGSMLIGFIVGSIMFSFVDHKIGDMDPINLRIAYVIVGLFLMCSTVYFWNLVMRGG